MPTKSIKLADIANQRYFNTLNCSSQNSTTSDDINQSRDSKDFNKTINLNDVLSSCRRTQTNKSNINNDSIDANNSVVDDDDNNNNNNNNCTQSPQIVRSNISKNNKKSISVYDRLALHGYEYAKERRSRSMSPRTVSIVINHSVFV